MTVYTFSKLFCLNFGYLTDLNFHVYLFLNESHYRKVKVK
jgi:hypothetical protein